MPRARRGSPRWVSLKTSPNPIPNPDPNLVPNPDPNPNPKPNSDPNPNLAEVGGRICLAVGSSAVLGTGGSVVCERKDGSLQSLQSLLDLPQHNGSPNPSPSPHPSLNPSPSPSPSPSPNGSPSPNQVACRREGRRR